jgi:hypothetical protein
MRKLETFAEKNKQNNFMGQTISVLEFALIALGSVFAYAFIKTLIQTIKNK